MKIELIPILARLGEFVFGMFVDVNEIIVAREVDLTELELGLLQLVSYVGYLSGSIVGILDRLRVLKTCG